MMSDEEWENNENLKKKEELRTKSAPEAEMGGMGGFGSTGGELGGGDFGASPEMGATTVPTPPVTPPMGGAPAEEIIPPAESTNANLKASKDLSLFSNWENADKNIKERYNGNGNSIIK